MPRRSKQLIRRITSATIVIIACATTISEAKGYVWARPYGTTGLPFTLRDDYPLPDAPHASGHKLYVDGCTIVEGGGTMRDIERAVLEWNAVRGMRDKLRLMGVRSCGSIWLKKRSRIRYKELRGISGHTTLRLNINGTITRARIDLDPSVAPAPDPYSCTSTANPRTVVALAVHELGHALNLGHNNYTERLSVMREANSGTRRALYCGTSNRNQPHPDDVGGARFLYPSSLQNDDIAPVAWVPDTTGPKRSTPVGTFGVCPEDIVNQQLLMSNRGTRQAYYSRKWYLSTDQTRGNDQLLRTETGLQKRDGAQYGVWWTTKSVEIPPTFTDPEPNWLIADITNAGQSRPFDRRNDWTYFGSAYRYAGGATCQ